MEKKVWISFKWNRVEFLYYSKFSLKLLNPRVTNHTRILKILGLNKE